MAALAWRFMTPGDVAAVKALSEAIHPGLPEREAVFSDRVAMYPDGCIALADGEALLGYAISHPAKLYAPPALDILLGAPPDDTDSYYIHDFVLDPRCRGLGLAAKGIQHLLEVAEDFVATALISVYGTVPFWERFGFFDESAALASGKLAPYGEGAVYMVRW